MSALTITFHAPRVVSDFRRTVLNKLVSDKLHTVRIAGSDATPDEVKQLGDSIPVLQASDLTTAKMRSHVVLYLKGRGYKVSAAPFESSADGAIIGYTVHAVKSDKPATGAKFRTVS